MLVQVLLELRRLHLSLLRFYTPLPCSVRSRAAGRRTALAYARAERREKQLRVQPGRVQPSASAPVRGNGSHSTRQNRMITPFGYRSPVATKIERISHSSSGAAVSNFGTARK